MAWTAHTIIQNGKAIPFEEARIHPLAVGLAYGAAVFEGIRAYMNPATGRLSVFRLEEHLVRLDQGMKFMRFDNPPSRDALRQGVLDSVRANAPDDDCYIRLQVHIESMGNQSTTGTVGWSAPPSRANVRPSAKAGCRSASPPGRASPTTPCPHASRRRRTTTPGASPRCNPRPMATTRRSC